MWMLSSRLVKSGFANSGKQMLRCKSCGKRFVVTAVSLLFIRTKTNPNGMSLSWIH
ncbi:IS1/IS1595 family N-terminal zinc-binding domain-containing protein [Holdemanella biformis]|uniref:IS1/IS1595 family N-terminal zinc-binding domain-containing protein n=1 Tax=Holdemanella biformis TaxID=1735 RepID=UPI004029D8BA